MSHSGTEAVFHNASDVTRSGDARAALRRAGKFGLSGIRERVMLLQGSMTISSKHSGRND